MTPELRVNARVLDLIARGKKSQITESDNVELKAAWGAVEDHWGVARQIAGCANASMGNDFILLIGVQEKPHFEVLGAADNEAANWWTKVKNCFAGAAPSAKTYVVPYEEKSIVAIVFDTALAPFMVKNQWRKAANQKGDIAAEVPWRELNGTRTATREELLSILVFSELTPACELLECKLAQEHKTTPFTLLTMTLYLEPKTERQVVIPFHRCEVYVRAPDMPPEQLVVTRICPALNMLVGSPARVDSITIQQSATEVLVTGPGTIELHARAGGGLAQYRASSLDVSAMLPICWGVLPIAVKCSINPRVVETGLASWRLAR
jgi:hypothetical protein